MRRSIFLLSVILGALCAIVSAPSSALASDAFIAPDQPRTKITFPVEGSNYHYSNDWGAPRAGGRTHQGNDIMSPKLTHIRAAANGKINFVRSDASGTSGNMLSLTGDNGWSFWYMHINNDSPGTDDGANPAEWRFEPGIQSGTRVKAGDYIAFVGDSGDAEGTAPHLHFEVHLPSGTAVNPYTSLQLAEGKSVGKICGFDTNPDNAPSNAAAAGYWTLGNDGGVFSFGSAQFYGSTGNIRLNQPVMTMGALPNGRGYWLAARDGGIFSYGDAKFYGSTGAMTLNQPIVGMAASPTGNGYWLVASDGGIFSYGDTKFLGSTGGIKLAKSIVGMAANPSGLGYWIVAKDGGVFSFGSAQYFGGFPGLGLCQWPDAAAIVSTNTGNGYYLQSVDGSVLAYGDAKSMGDPSVYGVHAAGLSLVH